MKKFLLPLAIGIVPLLVLTPQGNADVSTSGWYTIPEAHSGVGVVGATFAEDLRDTTDGASFVRFQDSAVCDSVKDSRCAGGYAQMLLTSCEVDDSSMCVMSLEVGDQASLSKAKFIRNVGKRIVQGDPAKGIPNGYNSTLWEIEKSSASNASLKFAVYVQYQVSVEGAPRAFRVSISPYREEANSQVKELKFEEVKLASGTTRIVGNNSAHGCVWTEDGLCGQQLNFENGARVKLDLKLNNAIAGFLNGRLQNPEISLDSLANGYQHLTVTGDPVEVQKSYAKFKTSEASASVLSLFNFEGFSNQDQYLATYTSTDSKALQVFETLSSGFSERADSLRTYWGFASAASATDQCLQSKNKILGLVTTNAMVYDARPPQFLDGELRYRVAGVHSKPNGEDFKGVYDLVIDSKAARCLYKYSNAPISASVSVTANDGGKRSIATTIVNERNGWFHLGAYGFGFSSPTVSVKLTQQTQASITCVKGKSIKKVTAVNPKCPTGYKKKA